MGWLSMMLLFLFSVVFAAASASSYLSFLTVSVVGANNEGNCTLPLSYILQPVNYSSLVSDQEKSYYTPKAEVCVAPCNNSNVTSQSMKAYLFQSEMQLVAHGHHVTDGALWCIAVSVLGHGNNCSKYIDDVILANRTAAFNSIRAAEPCAEEPQGGGYCYGKRNVSLAASVAYIFSVLSDNKTIEGEIDQRCPSLGNNWMWNSFVPLLGPTVWATLLGPAHSAALQAEYRWLQVPETAPVFQLGLGTVDAMRRIRDEPGGMMPHAPRNINFTFLLMNTTAQEEADRRTTEEHSLLLAGLAALLTLIDKQGPGSAFSNYSTLLRKDIHDLAELLLNSFQKAHTQFPRDLQMPSVADFCPYTQLVVMSVFGPGIIDQTHGNGSFFSIWRKVRTNFKHECGLQLCALNVPGSLGVPSGELTLLAINALRVAKGEEEKCNFSESEASELAIDLFNLESQFAGQLEKFFAESKLGGASVSAILEAKSRAFDTIRGAYVNSLPSLRATSFASLIALNFNPFVLKGRYIGVLSTLDPTASISHSTLDPTASISYSTTGSSTVTPPPTRTSTPTPTKTRSLSQSLAATKSASDISSASATITPPPTSTPTLCLPPKITAHAEIPKDQRLLRLSLDKIVFGGSPLITLKVDGAIVSYYIDNDRSKCNAACKPEVLLYEGSWANMKKPLEDREVIPSPQLGGLECTADTIKFHLGPDGSYFPNKWKPHMRNASVAFNIDLYDCLAYGPGSLFETDTVEVNLGHIGGQILAINDIFTVELPLSTEALDFFEFLALVAGLMGGGAGNMAAAAAQGPRFSLLIHSLYCDEELMGLPQTLGFALSPSTVTIDSAGDIKAFIGAVLFNLGGFFFFLFCHWLWNFGWKGLRYAKLARERKMGGEIERAATAELERRLGWAEVHGSIRFPSHSIAPMICYLTMPCVFCSIVVVRAAPDTGSGLAYSLFAVVSAVFWGCVTPIFVYNVVFKNFGCIRTCGTFIGRTRTDQSALHWFFFGEEDYQWVNVADKSPFFLQRFGFFFRDYRTSGYMFVFIEIGISIAQGLVLALPRTTNVWCQMQGFSSSILFFALFATVIAIRPFHTPVQTAVTGVVYGTNCVAAIAATLFVIDTTNDRALLIAVLLPMVSTSVLMLKILADFTLYASKWIKRWYLDRQVTAAGRLRFGDGGCGVVPESVQEMLMKRFVVQQERKEESQRLHDEIMTEAFSTTQSRHAEWEKVKEYVRLTSDNPLLDPGDGLDRDPFLEARLRKEVRSPPSALLHKSYDAPVEVLQYGRELDPFEEVESQLHLARQAPLPKHNDRSVYAQLADGRRGKVLQPGGCFQAELDEL